MWKRLVLCLALGSVAACTQDTAEMARIRESVGHYPLYLADCYQKSDLRAMRDVVTDDEYFRLLGQMMGLQQSKVRLVANVLSCKVEEITFPQRDRAKVKTEEHWSMSRIYTVSGKGMPHFEKIARHVSYELVRTDGKWLVERVRDVSR